MRKNVGIALLACLKQKTIVSKNLGSVFCGCTGKVRARKRVLDGRQGKMAKVKRGEAQPGNLLERKRGRE
jgi:hypothetical protein